MCIALIDKEENPSSSDDPLNSLSADDTDQHPPISASFPVDIDQPSPTCTSPSLFDDLFADQPPPTSPSLSADNNQPPPTSPSLSADNNQPPPTSPSLSADNNQPPPTSPSLSTDTDQPPPTNPSASLAQSGI